MSTETTNPTNDGAKDGAEVRGEILGIKVGEEVINRPHKMHINKKVSQHRQNQQPHTGLSTCTRVFSFSQLEQ